MYKRILSFILVGLILNLAFYSTAGANTISEKEAKFAAKVKTAVTKLGIGTEVRVKIKLRDKTKIKGYISETGEDSFSVFDTETKTIVQIPYSKVKQIKGRNNLTEEQITIVLGIALIIGVIIFALSGED